MALALVLLVGAGLVVESLRHLVAEPPGFDPDGVLTAEINLPAKRYPSPASRAQFYAALLPRLAALPGVSEAGFVTPLPFSNDSITTRLSVLGRDQAPADQPRSVYHAATPQYFRVMRIPLRRGRLLAEGDTREAPPVAVVNEAFVRTVFPGEDPIGRRIRIGVRAADGDPELFEIVGVVGDVHRAPSAGPWSRSSTCPRPSTRGDGACSPCARGAIRAALARRCAAR